MNTLIVVDDNWEEDFVTKTFTGKGLYIKEFFNDLGIEPLFSEYQIGWVKQ